MGRRTSKPIKLEAPAAPPPPPDPRQGYLFADMWSDNDNQPDTAAPGYFGVRGAPKLKKARKMKQSNCSCRVQVHRSTKTVRLIFTRDGEPKAHRYSFTAREALSLAEVLVDASELAAVLQIKKELN